MTESNLSLGYIDFAQDVGHLLGYGQDVPAFTAEQLADVNWAISAGLRRFYSPSPVEGEVHRWAFLEPMATLKTEAKVPDYDLPDDFGGIIGKMTWGESEGYIPIPVVGEGKIRERRQTAHGNAKPQIVAIRPKAHDPEKGQRFEALFWPTPDAEYNLTYRYTALLQKLTEAAPYPPGGMLHGETIRAAILWAAAEKFVEDEKESKRADYLDLLRSSIITDRRTNTPEMFLGTYGDTDTDSVHRHGVHHHHDYHVTYEGVTY